MSTTTNLGITKLVESQAGKVITINTALDKIDAAVGSIVPANDGKLLGVDDIGGGAAVTIPITIGSNLSLSGGTLNINLPGGTTNFLRADGTWAAPSGGGSGITGIGPTGSSQSGPSILLATGTSGTDFGITAATNTITFNLPSASASNRGLVTTSAQTFAGDKTFSGNIIGQSSIEVGTGSFSSGKARLYVDGALGLVVTGKTGSSSDLAFASAAGSIIFSNPTGTGDFQLINGGLIASSSGTFGTHIQISGGSFSSGNFRLYWVNNLGCVFATAKTGSTNDATWVAANGGVLWRNPTGTRNIEMPNGTFTCLQAIIGAGHIQAISTKTGAYTITATDHVILCDTTSAGFTVTLPTAVGRTGQIYTIKKKTSDGNTLTVATTSSQTIDGTTTVSSAAALVKWTVVSDGANWFIV